MIYAVAVFLVIVGLFFTYIAVGLARSSERKRGLIECDERIDLIRRQLIRRQKQ